MSCEPKVNACMIMDFVVSTCILHFIVQVKCKIVKHHTHAYTLAIHKLQRSVKSGGGGGAPAPGAPLLPTPLHCCFRMRVHINDDVFPNEL